MLDSIFTEYKFENKTTFAKILDYALYPTRQLLNFKTIQYDPQTKSFREEDQKCKNIFCKILLAVVAVALVPLTLVVCLIKALDHTAQKVHQQYQLKSQAGHSNERLRNRQESVPAFTTEQLEQLLSPYSQLWREEARLDLLSPRETDRILQRLGELSRFFNDWLTSGQEHAENSLFELTKLKPHVFLFKYKTEEESGPDIDRSANEKRWMILFQAYLESLANLVIGTSRSSNESEFYVYHKDIVRDPFDAAHITSMTGEAKPILLRSVNKTWVWIFHQTDWPKSERAAS